MLDMSTVTGRDRRLPRYLPPPPRPSSLPALPTYVDVADTKAAAGRRRQLLQRYSRRHAELLAMRRELYDEECCAEAADEDEGAEEEEDYTKQLGSLRASLHVKRREIKAMERQQQMQAEHVDALDAELAELRPRSTQLELQNASMRSTLRRSARQESVRRGEESWLREELERSHSEEQASEAGQAMQTVQTKLLRKEQALVRARTELRALRVKVQAQRAQLERERATISFLRQSPEEREIESRLRELGRKEQSAVLLQSAHRGATARKNADNTMRMASRIQSMFRAQKARSQMRADARSLRKDTQEARRAIAEARELQAEAESQTRQAQREVDATLRQLREARGELTLVRSELGHCREEISGIRVGQIQGGKRPAPALDSQSIPASPSMQMMGQAQASSVEQLAVLQVARVQEALQQAATDLASVAAAAVASPCSSISSSSRSQAASLAGPKGLTVQIPAADGDEATTAEQNVPGGSLLDALHPLGAQLGMTPTPTVLQINDLIDRVDGALDGLLALRAIGHPKSPGNNFSGGGLMVPDAGDVPPVTEAEEDGQDDTHEATDVIGEGLDSADFSLFLKQQGQKFLPEPELNTGPRLQSEPKVPKTQLTTVVDNPTAAPVSEISRKERDGQSIIVAELQAGMVAALTPTAAQDVTYQKAATDVATGESVVASTVAEPEVKSEKQQKLEPEPEPNLTLGGKAAVEAKTECMEQELHAKANEELVTVSQSQPELESEPAHQPNAESEKSREGSTLLKLDGR